LKLSHYEQYYLAVAEQGACREAPAALCAVRDHRLIFSKSRPQYFAAKLASHIPTPRTLVCDEPWLSSHGAMLTTSCIAAPHLGQSRASALPRLRFDTTPRPNHFGTPRAESNRPPWRQRPASYAVSPTHREFTKIPEAEHARRSVRGSENAVTQQQQFHVKFCRSPACSILFVRWYLAPPTAFHAGEKKWKGLSPNGAVFLSRQRRQDVQG
jgi:hypothetical protein